MRIKKEVKEFKSEFRKKLVEFIVGAFTFTAALTWNNTISSWVDSSTAFLKSIGLQKWILNLFTAIIVTVIAVIGIIFVSKILKEPS